MGYAGNDLRLSGAVLTSALFQNVGSTDGSILLKDIVPVLSDGSLAGQGNVALQYLKYDGSTDKDNNYNWRGTYWMNAKTMKKADDVIVPAGKGLWVINNAGGSTAISLRSSGELIRKDIVFPLNLSGAAPAANGFPVATTLGRIIPQLAADGSLAGQGNVALQYLKYDGSTDKDNNYNWRGTYWMNAKTMKKADDVVVPAGQGLWVINNAGGSTAINLRVIAPEL